MRPITSLEVMIVVICMVSCVGCRDAVDLYTPLAAVKTGMTLIAVQALFPTNGVSVSVHQVKDQRGDWIDGNALWKRFATNSATRCLVVDDNQGWSTSLSCVYFGADEAVIGYYYSSE
jgi:hypothetical protein